jgi:hypothetical protein
MGMTFNSGVEAKNSPLTAVPQFVDLALVVVLTPIFIWAPVELLLPAG